MGSAALGVAALTAGAAEKDEGAGKKQDVVVYVSCHPDDLGGSVGTVMRLAQVYDVHVVEFTHGERGLGEEGYRDGSTAKIRTAEDEAAIKAADLAGVRPEIYFQEQEIQSRGFVPAYYVDVSAQTERKRKIIEMWACQHGPQMAERKIQTSVVNGWRIGGMKNAEVFGIFPGTVTPGKSIFDGLDGVRQA